MADTIKPIRRYIARTACLVSLAFLLLIIGVGMETIVIMKRSGGSTVTCGTPQPFVRPASPRQVVFTAHLLYVGRTDPKYAMRGGHRFGPWAVAYVKHRYWGLPWWNSVIVVLAPGWFQQGGDYFVDGKGWSDDYSRYLPLVYTGPCNRTELLSDAVVDLRILSQGPRQDEARIIGRTYRRKPGSELGRGYEPAPGMRVEINGPTGLVSLTSDADAVYEITGLPGGHYSIRIDHPDGRDKEEGTNDRSLPAGDVWGRDLYSE